MKIRKFPSPTARHRVKPELERAWFALDAVQARNADRNPVDVLRDVTAVVESVRRDRYEKRGNPSRWHRK